MCMNYRCRGHSYITNTIEKLSSNSLQLDILNMASLRRLLVGGVLAVISLAPGAFAEYPYPGKVTGDTG